MILEKVGYSSLKARQQENYNFHKIAAILADYGFSCMWLNDDWQGADFIANHIDGETFLKVQLKGRLTIDKKYADKNIYVAFRQNDTFYLYPHDELMEKIIPMIDSTESWKRSGYSWPTIPKSLTDTMKYYELRTI